MTGCPYIKALTVEAFNPLVPAEAYLEKLTPASARAALEALGGEYSEQTLLELVAWYEGVGLREDARTLLTLAWEDQLPQVRISGGMEGFGSDAGRRFARNPLFQAWRGYLSGDSGFLSPDADPGFSFPYRHESLPVLRWAADQKDHWVWQYLLALNLWALDRDREAAELMTALGQRPDFGPFYVARGRLLADLDGTDPEPDLRRAIALDPSERILHVYLIRHLQDSGGWNQSLASAEEAAAAFPGDFTLALLEAKALIHLARPLEALEILAHTQVLPSENGRESHLLWEQAHTLAALDAMDSGRLPEAKTHLLEAMEWPESLGQGRPYKPEERLARFLLGRVEERLGNAEAARDAFGAVVAASGLPDPLSSWSGPEDILDLLTPRAVRALGCRSDADAMEGNHEDEFSTLRRTLEQTLEGQMIRRALAGGNDR